MSAVTLAAEARGQANLKVVTLLLAGAVVLAMAIPGLRTGGHDAMSTDDAMRLVEVRDLLAGQSWFDLTQHRLDPPGLPMHWSRVIDAPIAAMILLLRPLLGEQAAETAVLVLWPTFLFGAALMLVPGIAGQMAGQASRPAQLAALIAAALCAPALVHFRVGAIDHHNAQLVLLLGLFSSAIRIERSHVAAVYAGICATLSLAIGLEMLPMIAAACVVLFAALVWRGGPVASQIGTFGLTLAVSSAVLASLLLQPDSLRLPILDAFGGPVLLLIFGGGLCLVLVAVVSIRWQGFAARAVTAVLTGGTVLLLLLHLFPDSIASPYASVDPLVATYWLDRVSETMSIRTLLLLQPQTGPAYYLFPALALLLSAFALKRVAPGERLQWWLAIAMLAAAFAVSLWQMRGAAAASLIAAPLFPVSLMKLWRSQEQDWRPVLITLVASPACLAVSGTMARPVIDHVLRPQWTIASQSAAASCRTPSSVSPLASLPPGRVMAPIDLGPGILVATAHSIYAAPYHRNNDGNIVMLRTMMAPPAEARQLLQRHEATYLVLCRGSLELMEPEQDAPNGLAALLGRGETPDFLEPVEGPLGQLAVWRVR